MKHARKTSFLWGFSCLRRGIAPPPPSLRIGSIDDDLTKFNVGEGNTDETDSLNVIYIRDTSGTLDGVSNNPTHTAASKFYMFSILAPGCASQGDPVVQLDTTYDNDGHLTRTGSVELHLAVQAWENTVYDLNQNQSQFALCLQADIVMLNSELNTVLLEQKMFEFVVTILLPTFDFDEPNLDDNGKFVFRLPCVGNRRKKRRSYKVHSVVVAL